MSKVVYESNGQSVGPGMRVMEVSPDGGMSILTDRVEGRFSPVKLVAPDHPPILDAVQVNEATFTAGFTHLDADGGTLAASLTRKGTEAELSNLRFGLWVRVSEDIAYEKQWPTDEESADTSRRIEWSPGDEVTLHTWLTSPAGQQIRMQTFTVPGTA